MIIDLYISRLPELYDFHSKLYVNYLADTRPGDVQKRINQSTHHIVWLTGNLVSVRYRLGNSIGLKEPDIFYKIFKDQRPIQKPITYTDLIPIHEDWYRTTPVFRNRLSSLTEEELLEPQLFGTPVLRESNLLNTVFLLINRESYSIRKLELLRKIFGYQAKKYN